MRAGGARGESMVARVLRMEGTCTGEHGIGLGSQKFLEAKFGAETNALIMRAIKGALDPGNILKPRQAAACR